MNGTCGILNNTVIKIIAKTIDRSRNGTEKKHVVPALSWCRCPYRLQRPTPKQCSLAYSHAGTIDSPSAGIFLTFLKNRIQVHITLSLGKRKREAKNTKTVQCCTICANLQNTVKPTKVGIGRRAGQTSPNLETLSKCVV